MRLPFRTLAKKDMAERNKWSNGWLHFRERYDNSASCNICKMIISSKGGNTSKVFKHLSIERGLP